LEDWVTLITLPGTSSGGKKKMASCEAELDALVPYIQPGSAYYAAIVDRLLNAEGYAVLKAVLTETECQVELDRMWSFISKVLQLCWWRE
jgi:hypothetical protein